MPFHLEKLIATLMLPPVAPLLLSALGLLLLRRWRRGALALAWGGLALNLLLALPATAGWLEQRALGPEASAPGLAADAQAIVILTAGAHRHIADYDGETVGPLTLERLRAGARLARRGRLPVLISGGLPREGAALAELAGQALREFGVEARWLETRSRDTQENADFSAAMLRREGIRRVALVTHALHMPRAAAEFRRAGLEVVPHPTLVPRTPDYRLGDFWPYVLAYRDSTLALHELLGQLAVALRRAL